MGVNFGERPQPRDTGWTPGPKKTESEGSVEGPEKYKVATDVIDEFLKNENLFRGSVNPSNFRLEKEKERLTEWRAMPYPTEESEQFKRWKKRQDEKRAEFLKQFPEDVQEYPVPTYEDFIEVVKDDQRKREIVLAEFELLNRLKEEIERGEKENAIKYFFDFSRDRGVYHKQCLEAIRALTGY